MTIDGCALVVPAAFHCGLFKRPAIDQPLCTPAEPVWSKYWSHPLGLSGLSQPLSRWPTRDQNRNRLTSARLPNAIIRPGFPNACQNPCPTPDGSAHSLTPTEPLTALHRAGMGSIGRYRKQQDVAWALVVALSMIVHHKFVQRPPQ